MVGKKQPSFILEIPKRGRTCGGGQELLAPETEYYSVLVEDENGLIRRDYCLICWEKFAKGEQISKAASYWRAKVPAKQGGHLDNLSRDEKALELLREAIQRGTPEDDREAFVLALYLVRKKQLVLRDEIERDANMVNLYEDLATEEILAVKRIELPHLQIQKTQQELAKKLKKN